MFFPAKVLFTNGLGLGKTLVEFSFLFKIKGVTDSSERSKMNIFSIDEKERRKGDQRVLQNKSLNLNRIMRILSDLHVD